MGACLKLYEITKETRAVLDLVVETDGELTLAQAGQLDKLDREFQIKAQDIGLYIQEMSAEAKAVKVERDRLADRERLLTERIDWLKGYLLDNMKALQIERIKGELVTIRRQKNSQAAVVVLNEKAIPQKFWIPQDPILDKKAIAESVQLGFDVPGAKVERGEHVRVQ